MYRLVFNLNSRTMTKIQWREAWRWKRITEKRIEEATANRCRYLQDQIIPASIRQDMINEMINPPVMFWPDQPEL